MKYVALSLLLFAMPAAAETFQGPVANVVDGSTIVMKSGQRVRLFGILAPDENQQCKRDNKCMPCGEESRSTLEKLTASPIRCETWGKSLGRIVARCYGRGDQDLSLAMLRVGQAAVFKKYLRRGDQLPYGYLDAEANAKRQGYGMWAGEIEDPWYWRHAGARLPCEY